jgi:hypothetical protein
MAIERAVGPEAAGKWITQVSPAGWRALAATPLEPQDILRIARHFTPDQVAHLAPHLKGRGLLQLIEHAPDARLTLADGHVLVDGQLHLHPHALLRLAERGALQPLRQRLATARAMSPAFAELGPLTPSQLEQLEDLTLSLRTATHKPPAVPGHLLNHHGRSEALVLRVARELGEQVIHLGPRARALLELAPELRPGLEALQTGAVGQPLVDRTLRRLEQALARRDVTLHRPNLATWLQRATRSEQALRAELYELEYALHVADSGKAARGSTIYLGLTPGQRVPLAPNGPWVELPPPRPNQRGVLQDIDVLFLTPAGEVQLVEVKRSGQALWEGLEKTDGDYLKKFADWRAAGEAAGQKRRLAVAINHADDGWLDKELSLGRVTPRRVLARMRVEFLEHPGAR